MKTPYFHKRSLWGFASFDNLLSWLASRNSCRPRFWADGLYYDQCSDFAVSALVFLMQGEVEIVHNFLMLTLSPESGKAIELFYARPGLMPVCSVWGNGRIYRCRFWGTGDRGVAPVDSCLAAAAYGLTQSWRFGSSSQPEFQRGIRLILDLCLTARFDMFPTLLVPDGSFMIDRRMGVHGYPLEIALFYAALQVATSYSCQKRKTRHTFKQWADCFITCGYYWLDLDGLNKIYRYGLRSLRQQWTGSTSIQRFQIALVLTAAALKTGRAEMANAQSRSPRNVYSETSGWVLRRQAGSLDRSWSEVSNLDDRWFSGSAGLAR